jgi:putative ABC transport system ATP-binding protein
MSKQAIVEIINLNHFYGKGNLKKQILCDINLTLCAKEIVILTGPSGSGKTTLLTLIGALRSIQEGNLKVLGQQLYGANKKQLVQVRRQIGYIFQAHNLLGFLTARQNVQMAIQLQPRITATAAQSESAKMLERVGLAKHLDYYPENMSGGQKQRVAIARALVNRPQLVLADEPTAALDRQTGRNVVDLMEKMAKEQGCTILLVTHDNRILDIADRIINMEDGRLTIESNQVYSSVTGSGEF